MAKIQANNYKQAAEMFKVVIEDSVTKLDALPKEINEEDAGHFIVALVRRVNNPTLKKYEVYVNVQAFDVRAFDKLKKGVGLLGYDQAIVLHQPTTGQQAKSAVDSIINAGGGETAAEMEARIRKEIEAENKAKDGGKAGKQKDKAADKRKVNDNDPKAQDVSGFTADQLEQFALAINLDTKGAKNPEEVRTLIQEWQAKPYAKDVKVAELNPEELVAFAKENKIDIKGLETNDAVLVAVKNWQASQKK